MKFVGFFEGVKIYESSLFGLGHGLTIPEIGIIVSKGAFSQNSDPWLIKHEFGHTLQYKEKGTLKFYFRFGLPSLFSALLQNIKKNVSHKNHVVEVDANLKSFKYFKSPEEWPFNRFPVLKKD
ncbi:MAG: hypothetical protein ABIP95_00380 [Pelobium sp.]